MPAADCSEELDTFSGVCQELNLTEIPKIVSTHRLSLSAAQGEEELLAVSMFVPSPGAE